MLGAVVAAPLAAATGVVGASVIFGGLALLGVLLALGLSIRAVGAALGSGARHAIRYTRAGLGAADIAGPDTDDDGSGPFADDESESAHEPIHEPVPEPEPVRVVARDEHVEIALPTSTEPDGQMVIELGDDAHASR